MSEKKAKSLAELFAARLVREPAADAACRASERLQRAIAHHVAGHHIAARHIANQGISLAECAPATCEVRRAG